MQRLIPVVFLGLLAAGCVTTKAAVPIERPVLEVPPVPPRVVEAAPVPEPERIEPVPELGTPPAATPSTSKPRPSTPRDNRETQKPEPKPETPPAPDPAAAAPPPQAAPPPSLRTPAMADATAAERQIRDVLRRARSGLQSVDYQRLTSDRKKRYDEATDFINQAEDAIKKANFEVAASLADKADKYSRELQPR
jgi:hypothetical protein